MIDWLRGTGVALVTPFTPEGELDLPALDRIVQHMIKGSVEYLVVLGTTGESATLSGQEQDQVIRTVMESNQGKLPIVLGAGGNDTREVVRKAASYQKQYAPDGILSVCPYYNRPTQEGMYRHFEAIARAIDLPLILYNVPARTASNLLPSTTLRLAKELPNVVAIKEASNDLAQCMAILADKPEDFELISGEDALTLPLVALGASGVISVAANAFPKPFSDLVRATLSGDFALARQAQYRLLALMNLLFAEGNPAGVKAAMASQGLCEATVRLPLVAASDTLREQMSIAWNRAFES